MYYISFLNLIQGYFVPSSITCVNSMEVSYIPIAKARGFTTHWIKRENASTFSLSTTTFCVVSYSSILPSVEIVTTCHGMNLPLACSAVFAACSKPPQHGTSMRTTVTLFISLSAIMAVSFSL